MDEQVDGLVKKARVKSLLELSDKLMEKHIEKNLGTKHYVIAEQIKDGFLVGHTRDYLSVKFKGDIKLLGQEVLVEIIAIDKPYNLAEISY